MFDCQPGYQHECYGGEACARPPRADQGARDGYRPSPFRLSREGCPQPGPNSAIWPGWALSKLSRRDPSHRILPGRARRARSFCKSKAVTVTGSPSEAQFTMTSEDDAQSEPQQLSAECDHGTRADIDSTYRHVYHSRKNLYGLNFERA